MRSLVIGVLLVHSWCISYAQLAGAWKLVEENGQPLASMEVIKIYEQDYFMFARHTTDGQFLSAGGGHYTISETNYTETPDFDTLDSAKVRNTTSFEVKYQDNQLIIETVDGEVTLKQIWELVDDTKTLLTGVWHFGARLDENDKETDKRRGSGPRQTIKILSGTYFQWAAFNTATKQFTGTGGGIYSLSKGKYTETLHFFSRDNARVGKELSFSCVLKNKNTDWFHKGKSSAGGEVNEVWEKMK